MDLYSRYLFRQAGGALVLILSSLTSIVWIATALKQLTLVTSQGQTTWTFLKMTMLALPNLIAIIAPIALLITIIHTLNKANGDSELIVMTASGATVWRFTRPFLVLAFIVSFVLLITNHYVSPWSARMFEHYIAKVRTDLINQVLQPGQFASPEKRLTLHLRDRRFNGDLLGLVMHDARDRKLVTTYLAETGEVLKRGNGAFLLMRDGHIIRRAKGETPQIIAFEQYIIDLNQFGPKDESQSLKVRSRYLGELLNPDPNDLRFKREPGKFRSELHERFVVALYPIAFVLIVVSQLGLAQTTRQSRAHAIVIAFGCAAGLRLLGLAATNLLTLHAWAVWLVYGVPILGIVFALFYANARMRPRRQSKLSAVFEANLDAISDTAKRQLSWILPLRRKERSA